MIGKNIFRFRKTLGITQEDLSQKAGISRQTLSKIENNRTEPNSTTLMKIAQVLDIKIEELFKESKKLQNFRLSVSDNFDDNNELNSILEECSFWLMNYQMLEEQLNKTGNWELNDLSIKEPNKLANIVRDKYANLNIPIFNPVKILNKLGVRVYFYRSEIEDLKSFSGIEEYFHKPYLALNKSAHPNGESIIFNLFKELGHLFLHKSSYDGTVESKPKNEEQEANTFASYFLIPKEDFRKRLIELSGLHWVEQVLYLKKIYRVSYLKIIRRLPDEGVIGKNLIGDFINDFNQRYNKELDLSEGLPAEPFPNQELNFTNVELYRLVRKGLQENQISRNKAAGILSLTIEEMENIIQSWDEVKEVFINE